MVGVLYFLVDRGMVRFVEGFGGLENGLFGRFVLTEFTDLGFDMGEVLV